MTVSAIFFILWKFPYIYSKQLHVHVHMCTIMLNSVVTFLLWHNHAHVSKMHAPVDTNSATSVKLSMHCGCLNGSKPQFNVDIKGEINWHERSMHLHPWLLLVAIFLISHWGPGALSSHWLSIEKSIEINVIAHSSLLSQFYGIFIILAVPLMFQASIQ